MNNTPIGLPEPINYAIEKNEFNVLGNGISLSRLSQPPQVYHLKRVNSIREEVGDKVWALIKAGVMYAIEQNNEAAKVYRGAQAVHNAMKKKALEMRASDPDGKRAATLDKVRKIIADFASEYYPLDQERWMIRTTLGFEASVEYTDAKGKVSTVEKTVFDTIDLYDRVDQVLYPLVITRAKSSFDSNMRIPMEEKASLQAYLLEHNGCPVKAIKAVMIYKDFAIQKAMVNVSYPRHPSEIIELHRLKADKVEALITSRLRRHISADEGEVAECSPQDRWKEKDAYQIIKPSTGVVKAKGYHTPELAQEQINNNMYLYSGCVVDVQVGKSNRCDLYCIVSNVCEQYKRIRQEEIGSRTKANQRKP